MPRKSRLTAKKDRLIEFIEWFSARPLLTELTLTAITVMFGMQVLRALIPGIYWILGTRMGLSLMQLGLVGLIIFIIGFLAGPLSWLGGNRRIIIVSVAGLGLARLFMQVTWDEPIFNLALAIIGTIFFILFLPAYFDDTRIRGGASVSFFILGLLGGLALDTAINGAFGTYDIVWQAQLWPVLLTLVLFVIQLLLLVGISPAIYSEPKRSSATAAGRISLARSFAWLAIGPFLFLELVVFQNIPRLTTLTGWSLPMVFGLTLLAQLAGLAAAIMVINRSRRNLWLWAVVSGVILTAALVFANQPPAVLMAALMIIGQVLLSSIMAMVLIGIASSKGRLKHSSIWMANGIGTVLFILLIFAYYAVYNIRLPYNHTILEPIAGGIVAACAIGAVITVEPKVKAEPRLWAVPVFALILLALPVAQIVTWRTPVAVAGQGFPVTVMTYDLNNGFDLKGKLNIDKIAEEIETNMPDIVALQDVSRGWVTNGGLDMLAWLSYRLNMTYVFEPTTDPLSGNAILSRYPITAYTQESLPPADSLIKRGFVTALINVTEGQYMKVLTTQLDAAEADSDIRQLQAQTIIDFWAGLDSTVILGNFNAEPSSPEIYKLYYAQLHDFFISQKTAYTFPSNNPWKRIDYILTSPDLRVTDGGVSQSTASNHLPVVAVIDR